MGCIVFFIYLPGIVIVLTNAIYCLPFFQTYVAVVDSLVVYWPLSSQDFLIPHELIKNKMKKKEIFKIFANIIKL